MKSKNAVIGSGEAAEKHISAKIFKENLHTSVKILQICMDLQDSVQRFLQNPAEKILQICTDSQRSKTWVYKAFKKIVSFGQYVITFCSDLLRNLSDFVEKCVAFYRRN